AELDEQRGVDLSQVVLADHRGEARRDAGDAAVDEAAVPGVERPPGPGLPDEHLAHQGGFALGRVVGEGVAGGGEDHARGYCTVRAMPRGAPAGPLARGFTAQEADAERNAPA